MINLDGVETENGSKEQVEINITEAEYADKNVGVQKATVKAFALSNAEVNANYELTSTDPFEVEDAEKIEITKRELTLNEEGLKAMITAGGWDKKVYDGFATVLEADDKGTDHADIMALLPGVFDNDTVTADDLLNVIKMELAADYTDANVGNVTTTITFSIIDPATANYTIAGEDSTVETINAEITNAGITVTAEMLLEANSDTDVPFTMKKVYDTTVNGKNGDGAAYFTTKLEVPGVNGEMVKLTITEAEFNGKDVGTKAATVKSYELTAGETINTNYKLASIEPIVVEDETAIEISQRAAAYHVTASKYFGQPYSFFNMKKVEAPSTVEGEIYLTIDTADGITDDEQAVILSDLFDKITVNSYEGATDVYMLAEYATTAEIAGSEFVTLTDTVNYSALTADVKLTINEYAPEVAFTYTGTAGNEDSNNVAGDGWFKANPVTVTAKDDQDQLVMLEPDAYTAWTATADKKADEWKADYIYELDETVEANALLSDKNTATTHTFYLRNNVEGDEYLAIAKDSSEAKYYHDPAYWQTEAFNVSFADIDGNKTDKLTLHTKDIIFTLQEESKITINGVYEVDGTGDAYVEADTYTYVIGQNNEKHTLEGTDIFGAAINVTRFCYGTADDKTLDYVLSDVAGNTVTGEYSVSYAPLSIELLDTKTENGGLIHMSENGAIVITGEPNEMITLERKIDNTKDTFHAVLGDDGTYTLNMKDQAVSDFFMKDSGNIHHAQTLVVTYTDSHLSSSYETQSFVFDTKALPINSVVWTNRGAEMIIDLPEWGTITDIQVQGVASYEATTSGSGPLTVAIDLNEPDLPRRSVTIGVTYTDVLGHSFTGSYSNTGVDKGMDIEATIEPMLDENYVDARSGSEILITMYGTAFENVTLDFHGQLVTHKLSGDGQWDAGTTGISSQTLSLKGMPRNTGLTCFISYQDIDGTPFSRTIMFDDYCDTPVITSPVYEDMRVLTGKVEPNSVVYVIYDGEKIKGKVSPSGYFEVEMPMLFAGDTFELHCVDIAYNRSSITVEIPQLDEVETQAYPMGRLMADEENNTWYMGTRINAAENTQFTVPVLAGGSFEIGSCTFTVENGKAKADFTIDVPEEEITITSVDAGMVDRLTDEVPESALSEVDFENKSVEFELPAEGTVYLITRINCVLDVAHVEDSYQSEWSAEFEKHQ